MPVQECRSWRHCYNTSASCIPLRHRLHATAMHPRIILRHKSPCSSLLGSHFSKASTTHKNDLVSAIFFTTRPPHPFLKIVLKLFRTVVSVAAFALFVSLSGTSSLHIAIWRFLRSSSGYTPWTIVFWIVV